VDQDGAVGCERKLHFGFWSKTGTHDSRTHDL
jgi:hypothetical protein